MEAHLPAIASVIQLAVAPVFLLTAIGTIIAALNFRLGRAVDRRRSLERRLAKMEGQELGEAQDELATIALRIRTTYLAILSAVVSALFVCLLIAGAFLGAFVRVDLSATIGTLFVLSIVALIACLLLFLREIFLAVSTPRHVPR
jgi:hypothetical protein